MRDLRLSYDQGISFGTGARVADAETPAWWVACLDQATRLVNGLAGLLTKALNDALSARDGGRIASCARLIGTAYRDALEWAIILRRTHVTEDWRPVVHELSVFTRDIVVQIEGLAEVNRRDVHQAVDGINQMTRRPLR
jgi:hypothetical protein